MSPLGPILGEEAGVPLQDRRHVLLQVRTADPFFRYDHHLRSEQTSSPRLAEDIVDNDDTRAKMKRVEKIEVLEKEEDENENGIISDRFERINEQIVPNSNNERFGDRINERVSDRITSKSEEDDDDEMEDDDEEMEKRNGSFHEDEDVEVDVCRDGDESNPSSPVDLTASSRCSGSEQFLHPFANRGLHSFSCLQNGANIGGQATGHPVFLSGHTATGSTTLVTVCSASNQLSETNGPSGGNIITTTASSVQSNKRGLAFSVENILDPNKFTGGRVIHGRLQHRRRRRAGSIHEGTTKFCKMKINF